MYPFARLSVDGLYEINPNLKIEGGLFGTVLGGDGLDEQRLEPRAGVAWIAG